MILPCTEGKASSANVLHHRKAHLDLSFEGKKIQASELLKLTDSGLERLVQKVREERDRDVLL